MGCNLHDIRIPCGWLREPRYSAAGLQTDAKPSDRVPTEEDAPLRLLERRRGFLPIFQNVMTAGSGYRRGCDRNRRFTATSRNRGDVQRRFANDHLDSIALRSPG